MLILSAKSNQNRTVSLSAKSNQNRAVATLVVLDVAYSRLGCLMVHLDDPKTPTFIDKFTGLVVLQERGRDTG